MDCTVIMNYELRITNLNRLLKFGIFIFLFSLLGLACTNKTICLEPQIVVLRGGFYYSNSDTSISLKDTFLTNFNIIFGADTLYLDNLKNSRKFSVPLSTISDSTRFYFIADSTNIIPENIDTIDVLHENKLNFISVACGYQLFHDINKINFTKHIIDTLYISSTTVNSNVNLEHLKIVIKK